jgi:uncharacterized protein YvpB
MHLAKGNESMPTHFFKIVSTDPLRVRTRPEISDATLVRDRSLLHGDILEVNSESRTEAGNYVWWEHANSPGLWSASEKLKPSQIFMEAYQPPHDPKPPKTADPTSSDSSAADNTSQPILFEVVADRLSVRSQPKLGNTVVNGQVLLRSQRLRFQPTPTKADGFIWWEQVDHPGWWAASGSLQGGQTYMNPVDVSVEEEGNTHLLTVPWVTQIQTQGVNFANDCGHTSVLMVMRYNGLGWNQSVGDLYKLPYKTREGTTTNQHLPQIARDATGGKLVFTPFAAKPAALDNLHGLKTTLLNDKPVILLVWYPSLNFNNRASGPFSHWIVITGYKGDTFYLNDPLWLTENRGAGRTIDIKTLLKACQDTNNGLYGVS